MTPEQFKNTPDYLDMIYIGLNKGKMEFAYTENEEEIVCVVTNESDARIPIPFSIYNYLKLYISYDSFEAAKEQKESEQVKIFARTKSDIIHIIESLKRMTEKESAYIDVEKLGGFVNQCDALILMAQTNLQAKVLDNQMSTNENVVSTNDKIIFLNRRMTVILWITVIATFVAAIPAYYTLFNDKRIEVLEQDKSKKSIELQEVNKKQHQTESERDSLIKLVTFLKKKP